MNTLDALVADIEQMPPLSEAALRLLETFRNPDRTLEEMAKVIETDAGLAANLLKLVNSPAMAPRMPINSIVRALSFLGDKILLLTVLESAHPGLYTKPLAGYEGQKGELWRHSLHTAVAARRLAELSYTSMEPGLAFTAALLHDLGKVVISKYLEGLTPEIAFGIELGHHTDFLEAEQTLLGTTHAEAGRLLAEHWRLPEPLPQVMGLHHTPSKAPPEHMPLTYVVHLADAVAMWNGDATSADAMQYLVDENFESFIHIGSRDIDRLMLATAAECEAIRVDLNGEATLADE